MTGGQLLLIQAAREDAEYPHQVSVTDGDFRLFIHFWLGMVGNPQPCRFDHRQVIGSIANRHGLRQRDFILLREAGQGFRFLLRVNDVADHIAGKFTVHDLQFIGYHGCQAQLVAQVFSKESKAAGGNRHFPAQRFQLEYQLR